MKRSVMVLLSVWLMIAMLVTACGGASSNTGGSSSGSNSSGTSGTSTSSGNTQNNSSSNVKRKVVVYSPNNPELNNPVIKEFQDRTGIEVELITAGTGELINRIKAEANNPLGDVLYGGGQESHDAIAEYLEPYVTSEAEHLMSDYLDPNGIWTPQSILPMIIMYNKDLVPEGQEPKGWYDLLDPKWKGQIAYADPAKSASSYTQLVTMMTAFGLGTEEGWNTIKKFVDNLDGKILSGSALVYQGVADKEFALGVTSEDAALRYVVNGANVGIIYPVEGTSARTDGNSIIKGAKNLKEAQEFIDFISSKDVHDIMSKEFLRRSVRKDTSFEIEGIVKTEDMAVLPYDSQWASDNKDAVIERFNRIVIGAE